MATPLKSGTLVVLLAKREDMEIWARRFPETLVSPRSMRQDVEKARERVVITEIPDGTRVLYMSSKRDDFSAAIAGKGKGPYGWRPGDVVFHFVLWGDRPVWVSSEDASLEEVKGA